VPTYGRPAGESGGCSAERFLFQHGTAVGAADALDLVRNAVALAENVLLDGLVAVHCMCGCPHESHDR